MLPLHICYSKQMYSLILVFSFYPLHLLTYNTICCTNCIDAKYLRIFCICHKSIKIFLQLWAIYFFFKIKWPCIPFPEVIFIIRVCINLYDYFTSRESLFDILPKLNILLICHSSTNIQEVRLLQFFKSSSIISAYRFPWQ